MRKTVLVLAVFVLVLAAAPTASARHSLSHRVSALETKVNALHKFTHNCLAADWVPIGWYGNESQNWGYVFDNDGAGTAQAPFYTSALDIAPAPDQTAFVVAQVNPGCLSQIAARASFRARVDSLHRSLKRLR
jgi:hypothetical protein